MADVQVWLCETIDYMQAYANTWARNDKHSQTLFADLAYATLNTQQNVWNCSYSQRTLTLRMYLVYIKGTIVRGTTGNCPVHQPLPLSIHLPCEALNLHMVMRGWRFTYGDERLKIHIWWWEAEDSHMVMRGWRFTYGDYMVLCINKLSSLAYYLSRVYNKQTPVN
jgi:hypothetical protein